MDIWLAGSVVSFLVSGLVVYLCIRQGIVDDAEYGSGAFLICVSSLSIFFISCVSLLSYGVIWLEDLI